MDYKNIDFKETFFIIELEDERKISIPYSTIDHVSHLPKTRIMTVVLKKLGECHKTYPNYDELEGDMVKLMGKGKVAC